MKKKLIFPLFLIAGLVFLTGCSKVSLTNTNTPGAGGGPDGASMGTPPEGQIPADGQLPPDGSGGAAPTDGGGA
jgi:hypothetical protein